MHDGAAGDHLLHDLAHAAAGREQVLAGLQRPLFAIDAHTRREHQRVRDHAGIGQLVGDAAHAQAALDHHGVVDRRRPGLVELCEAPIDRPTRQPDREDEQQQEQADQLTDQRATARR